MTAKIMVQGTASGVGKTAISAGLCRLFRRKGFKTAPFKGQNMTTHTYSETRLSEENLIMGTAQLLQSEAAGITPGPDINPVLLRPAGKGEVELIVRGRSQGIKAGENLRKRKEDLKPLVRESFERLSEKFDAVVMEGAGSPAEINLDGEVDLANMGIARMASAPVILAGDIERGGVFASLFGTVRLLPPHERELIQGLIINKFRGNEEILKSGIVKLENMLNIPVLGVLPYLDFDLPEEDSITGLKGRDDKDLSPKLTENEPGTKKERDRREDQYEKLADMLADNLDLDTLFEIMKDSRSR